MADMTLEQAIAGVKADLLNYNQSERMIDGLDKMQEAVISSAEKWAAQEWWDSATYRERIDAIRQSGVKVGSDYKVIQLAAYRAAQVGGT